MRVLPRTLAARPLLDIRGAKIMSDHICQILLGAPLPENERMFEDAIAAVPAFALAHTTASISDLVSYLAGSGNFIDKQRFAAPDLVLLDLNLSGRGSGFEVLRWIQSRPTRSYRVVVFSAAADDSDCEEAYACGADGYVAKPASVSEVVAILSRIEGWLKNSLASEIDQFCVA